MILFFPKSYASQSIKILFFIFILSFFIRCGLTEEDEEALKESVSEEGDLSKEEFALVIPLELNFSVFPQDTEVIESSSLALAEKQGKSIRKKKEGLAKIIKGNSSHIKGCWIRNRA